MLTRRQTPRIFVSFCAVLFVASCSQSQRVATDTNTNEIIVSATPPFQTKEPERYRATRTITTVSANGETTVTKNLIARDGELRRDETQLATQPVVYLYLPSGKFLLVPDEKVFVALTKVDEADTSAAENESESSPDRLLHTEPIATSYQRLGSETVGGRTTQKFRVIVNGSTEANVSSNETTIWIDETLHMPIKSETTAGDGKRVTMELSDIALEVDQALFRIPENYQKIDFNELRKRWNSTE